MKIKIVHDVDPYFNPNDHVVNLYCWHKRYNIGQAHEYRNPTECFEDKKDDGLSGKVYMYDHGQIALSCQPFNDGFDSGLVGVWNISAKDLAEFPDEESARRCVVAFLDEYTEYINGNVYGVRIVADKICDCCGQTSEDIVDSCYGFFGSDHEKSGLYEFCKEVLGEDWKAVEIEEC